MNALDEFVAADLAASKETVQRYLERGFVKPALARLQECLSRTPGDEEILALLARAFEQLGKQEKAEYVQGLLERRRYQERGDEPTLLYIDMREFDPAQSFEDAPTGQFRRTESGSYVRMP